MSRLLRLVYLSRATDAFDSSSLEDILEKAQVRNALADVSGVLCSGRGYFIQALEGLEGRVLPLYSRILEDPRHHQASILCIELASTRAFKGWSMAHIDGNKLNENLHARLTEQAAVTDSASASVKLLQGALRSLRRST